MYTTSGIVSSYELLNLSVGIWTQVIPQKNMCWVTCQDPWCFIQYTKSCLHINNNNNNKLQINEKVNKRSLETWYIKIKSCVINLQHKRNTIQWQYLSINTNKLTSWVTVETLRMSMGSFKTNTKLTCYDLCNYYRLQSWPDYVDL